MVDTVKQCIELLQENNKLKTMLYNELIEDRKFKENFENNQKHEKKIV